MMNVIIGEAIHPSHAITAAKSGMATPSAPASRGGASRTPHLRRHGEEQQNRELLRRSRDDGRLLSPSSTLVYPLPLSPSPPTLSPPSPSPPITSISPAAAAASRATRVDSSSLVVTNVQAWYTSGSVSSVLSPMAAAVVSRSGTFGIWSVHTPVVLSAKASQPAVMKIAFRRAHKVNVTTTTIGHFLLCDGAMPPSIAGIILCALNEKAINPYATGMSAKDVVGGGAVHSPCAAPAVPTTAPITSMRERTPKPESQEMLRSDGKQVMGITRTIDPRVQSHGLACATREPGAARLRANSRAEAPASIWNSAATPINATTWKASTTNCPVRPNAALPTSA